MIPTTKIDSSVYNEDGKIRQQEEKKTEKIKKM